MTKQPKKYENRRCTDIVFGVIRECLEPNHSENPFKMLILAMLANARHDEGEGWMDYCLAAHRCHLQQEEALRLLEEMTADPRCYVERRNHPKEDWYVQYRFDRPRYDEDDARWNAAWAQLEAEEELGPMTEEEAESLCSKHRAMHESEKKGRIQ